MNIHAGTSISTETLMRLIFTVITFVNYIRSCLLIPAASKEDGANIPLT